MLTRLNNIGRPATLKVRDGVTQDPYGNDVPSEHDPIELDNVFIYSNSGSIGGDPGEFLMVERTGTALLPIGTKTMLDGTVGHHSLAGATIAQDGIEWEVLGEPLPYPDGTSPFSWEWNVPVKAVTG